MELDPDWRETGASLARRGDPQGGRSEEGFTIRQTGEEYARRMLQGAKGFIGGFVAFGVLLLVVGLLIAGAEAPQRTPVPEQVRIEERHREEDRQSSEREGATSAWFAKLHWEHPNPY
jgi:hypothetical protein